MQVSTIRGKMPTRLHDTQNINIAIMQRPEVSTELATNDYISKIYISNKNIKSKSFLEKLSREGREVKDANKFLLIMILLVFKL